MSDSTGFDAMPDRYALEGGREAIDVIREELGDEGFVAFCRGNALKYRLRAGKKGPAQNDLDKADWYGRMAKHVESGGVYLDPRSFRSRT